MERYGIEQVDRASPAPSGDIDRHASSSSAVLDCDRPV
jgi:hypothetical protein